MTRALCPLMFAATVFALASQVPVLKWPVNDRSRPHPPVIEPGNCSSPAQPCTPPSDAMVLFNGKDLSAWVARKGGPARWAVRDGYFETVPDVGDLRTVRSFGDCQLHLEWATPNPPRGTDQDRGNSGVYLMGKYEIQILDSYKNVTYADGQAGAVYGQYPPLVNPVRAPGEFQTYDIVFHGPRFGADGSLQRPATVTVLLNGVLVQDHVTLTGPTEYENRPPYRAHPAQLPLVLQDHHHPVRFRNVWIRELKDSEPAPAGAHS